MKLPTVKHHYDQMTHTVSVSHDGSFDGIAQAVRVGLAACETRGYKPTWLTRMYFRVTQVDIQIAEDSVDNVTLKAVKT